MKNLFTTVLISISLSLTAQTKNPLFLSEIEAFQKELNATFKDSLKSPLKKESLASFKGLEFYPANEAYSVQAVFKRTPDEQAFKMSTTTERLPEYIKYGELHFLINENPYQLNVYQSVQLINKTGFEDYLFLPFTDLTNGSDSYGGGRYIDFKIPKTKKVILDFNKSYNPYCAYNESYSCPIPPAENFIGEEIKAGVMYIIED
jgi:uncharacterized protein